MKMCDKTCYTCAETQGECFGGVCSIAGEISDSYAKKEHKCHKSPLVKECKACNKHCKVKIKSN
jgi:hypothetical protein